jgi:hypothetical protein
VAAVLTTLLALGVVFTDGARIVTVDVTPPSPTSTPSRSGPTSTPSRSETIPSVWDRFASFESTLNGETDFGWRIDPPFEITRTTEVGGTDGDHAAKIVTNGGTSGCSCPRMTFQEAVSYGPGDELWMGGSWYVSDPSKLLWSRLMNLGHFEASGDPDNWYLALRSREAAQMEVVASSYNTDARLSVLMRRRPIPEDRWFDVDIHARLAPTDGRALTEVYLDGRLVAKTKRRNMAAATPLHFFNAGLTHFWPGNGSTTVFLDAPRLTQ